MIDPHLAQQWNEQLARTVNIRREARDANLTKAEAVAGVGLLLDVITELSHLWLERIAP